MTDLLDECHGGGDTDDDPLARVEVTDLRGGESEEPVPKYLRVETRGRDAPENYVFLSRASSSDGGVHALGGNSAECALATPSPAPDTTYAQQSTGNGCVLVHSQSPGRRPERALTVVAPSADAAAAYLGARVEDAGDGTDVGGLCGDTTFVVTADQEEGLRAVVREKLGSGPAVVALGEGDSVTLHHDENGQTVTVTPDERATSAGRGDRQRSR